MPAPFLDEPPVPQTLFNYIRLHYIRLVTLDCITKTGSFMTCDGNITLHYITLREDIILYLVMVYRLH